MNIIQLGTCVGNDDLTKLIGDTQPDILILVEPMLIHNEKITECYGTVKNKHIENISISVSDEEEMSFFYHENDGPMYEVSSTNINHITKHGYDTKGIKELKVKCIRINNLFKKFNLKKIDILFIDTEGIDDLIIKDIDFNSFEINEIYFENLHLTQNDIYSFLENKGYKIIKIWGYMGWTSYAKKI
jgi:FkbM family methyltransferase